MQGPGPLFVLDKKDGFGERLRGLVNAFILQEMYGGEVRFTWHQLGKELSKFHDINPASETFSDAFVKRHLITRNQCDALDLSPLPEAVEKIRRGEKNVAAQVVQNPLDRQIRDQVVDLDLLEMGRRAFRKIEFSPPLKTIWDRAQEAKLPENPVAIHIRAGDVVYSTYRFSDDFRVKVICYPLIEHLIGEIKAAGGTPVLFGQDSALQGWLADRHAIRLASETWAAMNLSSLELAVFELGLISRCQRIICGNSGFPLLAAQAAGLKGENPYHMRPKKESAELVERCMLDTPIEGEPHPLQKAFACRSVFFLRNKKVAETPEEFTLLEKALALDPENAYYAISLACSLFDQNRIDEGEETLRRFIEADKEALGVLDDVLRKRHPRLGTVAASPYLETLERAGQNGASLAASLGAAGLMATGEKDRGRALKDLAGDHPAEISMLLK